MIEDKEDYFEKAPEDIPPKVKPPKKIHFKSDDPRYYEEEESRWEHLKPAPNSRGPVLWTVASVVIVMCLLAGLYVYIFTPKVKEAAQFGYVDRMQREGTVFTTFEGVLLPYKSLMDTIRPYEGDFVFSASNDTVAAELLKMQGKGRPVKVNYKVYRFAFPWRGKSNIIVTGVDSVDPKILLPPDRQPDFIKGNN